MANGSLIEQLDEAVEAIIAHPGAPLPRVSSHIAAELGIAAELRDLPRAEFKARLKADLERKIAMTATATKQFREGFHTITPYLIVNEVVGLIDFVKQAFGAQELFRSTGSAGGFHSEVRIGDSMIMLGGGGAWRGTPTPTAIHLYVEDADAVYKQAVAAGATSLHEPVDQPYGDREASVKDLSGNHWYIATHKGAAHVPEGLRTVTPYLHPRGASQMIDFLERAFGAEEQSRAASPDGVIHHATVRIGDSMVEMGEAHGPWQPMPTTFYLYVNDVDAWYQRAIEAGAASRGEPADQPYGDRVGGVADPFENTWYLSTPIK
ncbi:MAG TPA: VOC family protein [Blastocatellia bacterium]|nr:VOC family protein [Blastocatellia bacterium]